MSRCGHCGQRANPKEAPVTGPAVILGNGSVMPFESDEIMDRWVEWKQRRGETRMTVVRSGESHP